MSGNGYPNPTTKVLKLSEIHGSQRKKFAYISQHSCGFKNKALPLQ